MISESANSAARWVYQAVWAPFSASWAEAWIFFWILLERECNNTVNTATRLLRPDLTRRVGESALLQTSLHCRSPYEIHPPPFSPDYLSNTDLALEKKLHQVQEQASLARHHPDQPGQGLKRESGFWDFGAGSMDSKLPSISLRGLFSSSGSTTHVCALANPLVESEFHGYSCKIPAGLPK